MENRAVFYRLPVYPFKTASVLTVGRTQPPVQWVPEGKRPKLSSLLEVKISWRYSSVYILLASVPLLVLSRDQFSFETSLDEVWGRLSCTYPPYVALRNCAFHRQVGFWAFIRREAPSNPLLGHRQYLGFLWFLHFLQTNVAILLYIRPWTFLFSPLKSIIYCHPLVRRYMVSVIGGMIKYPENKK